MCTSTGGANITNHILLADLITPSLINYQNSTDRFPRSSSVSTTFCFWSQSSLPSSNSDPGLSTKVHNPRRLKIHPLFLAGYLRYRQRGMTKVDKILSRALAFILSVRNLSFAVLRMESPAIVRWTTRPKLLRPISHVIGAMCWQTERKKSKKKKRR